MSGGPDRWSIPSDHEVGQVVPVTAAVAIPCSAMKRWTRSSSKRVLEATPKLRQHSWQSGVQRKSESDGRDPRDPWGTDQYSTNPVLQYSISYTYVNQR